MLYVFFFFFVDDNHDNNKNNDLFVFKDPQFTTFKESNRTKTTFGHEFLMNKTSKPRLPAPKIDLSLEQQQQQPQQNLFNHPKDISITKILSEQKSK